MSEQPEQSSSPLVWLWAELERRFGPEVAGEIHQGFLEQQRRYQQHKQHTKRDARRRARAQAGEQHI